MISRKIQKFPQTLGLNMSIQDEDKVNSPSYYRGNGIEAIDVIEAFELRFNLGNAIKYILRADHKANKQEDLEKAKWYLNREIEKINREIKEIFGAGINE